MRSLDAATSAQHDESPAAELERAREDLASESLRADLGELARPMSHDVNNLLNNLMLNLMILKQEGGGASQISIDKLRGQAEQVAALVKEFQDYRRPTHAAAANVDIARGVFEAVRVLKDDFPGLLEALTLDLQPDLPPVRGSRPEVVRLLRFVLKNAARAAKSGLHVSAARSAAGLALQIHVRGLEVLPESPAKLFDLLAAKAPAMSGLELAAAKSIARRFGGKFQASAEPGGVTIILEMLAGAG